MSMQMSNICINPKSLFLWQLSDLFDTGDNCGLINKDEKSEWESHAQKNA
jgi:hypothetical protein